MRRASLVSAVFSILFIPFDLTRDFQLLNRPRCSSTRVSTCMQDRVWCLSAEFVPFLRDTSTRKLADPLFFRFTFRSSQGNRDFWTYHPQGSRCLVPDRKGVDMDGKGREGNWIECVGERGSQRVQVSPFLSISRCEQS